MKMKDYIKLKETSSASLKEEQQTDDTLIVPGKTVAKKEKRYTQYYDDGYDEEDFWKADSTVDYPRSMKNADDAFSDIGQVDYKYQDKFFTNFPVINVEDAKNLKEAYNTSYNEGSAFIVRESQTDYVLINTDNEGTVFKNKLVYESDSRRIIIECNDPECFNIYMLGRDKRNKHRLRSKEFGYINEFTAGTGMECWIKMNNNTMRI